MYPPQQQQQQSQFAGVPQQQQQQAQAMTAQQYAYLQQQQQLARVAASAQTMSVAPGNGVPANTLPANAALAFAAMMANAIDIASGTNQRWDPNKVVNVEDFDGHTEVTLFVKLQASLQQLKDGVVKPSWTQKDPSVFQRIIGRNGNQPIYGGDVRKLIFLTAECETLSSNFPCDLGAVHKRIQGREVYGNGKRYLFIAEAKRATAPKKCILQLSDPITRGALEKYGKFSPDALKKDMFRSADGTVCLVPNTSYVGKMLRNNAAGLGLNFGNVGPNDAAHTLKVNSVYVDACLIAFARSQEVNFMDGNQFTLDFERPETSNFTDPVGVCDNINRRQGANAHIRSNRMIDIYTLTAKVRAKVVCYDGTEAANTDGAWAKIPGLSDAPQQQQQQIAVSNRVM